jgi:hypothetical protein
VSRQDDQAAGALAVVLTVPAAGALAVIGALFTAYNGWVASILWGWFVVPLGLPVLAWWQLGGAALILSVLRGTAVEPKTDQAWYTHLLTAILAPLGALAMGWVILWVAS